MIRPLIGLVILILTLASASGTLYIILRGCAQTAMPAGIVVALAVVCAWIQTLIGCRIIIHILKGNIHP